MSHECVLVTKSRVPTDVAWGFMLVVPALSGVDGVAEIFR